MRQDKMTQNDKIPELTGNEFNDFTKDGLVFVDFFTEWCMPCLMMAPILEEMSDKFEGKIKFAKVNVDDEQQLAQQFRISSIPNFVLFKDGKPVEQFVGAVPAEELESKLRGFV